jgi:hypothetical protein
MKKTLRLNALHASLGVLLLSAAALSATALSAPPRDLDPETDRILRDMSAFLEGQTQFRFRTVVVYDVVENDLFKVQYTARQKVEVRRPDHFRAHYDGDLAEHTAYYDGATFTYLDNVERFYGTLAAPATIDEMLDKLIDEAGIQIVVSDLLYSSPYDALTEVSEYSDYLGIHAVGEHRCHHIAVRTPAVDWQLWVDVGDEPLPRRMVLTNRDDPTQPQYTVNFVEWDLDPHLPRERFVFEPPEGALRVRFGERKQAEQTGEQK